MVSEQKMINKKPKVSIVIPVYNAEKYLKQCLNSIISQTYHNIEIICIDDGSNDNSLNILKRYAEDDNRFIVLKQQNQGAAVARNEGIKRAAGKYIIFLDSDDYFSIDLIDKNLNKAEKFNTDITIFKAVTFESETGKTRILNDEIDKFKAYFNKTFSITDIPNNIFNSFLLVPWNKFYRTDFIKKNGLYFQNIKRSNDIYFTTTSLVKAQKIILLNDVLTYYRKGTNKNLQAGNEKTPLEFYKALNKLKNYLEKEKIYQLAEKSFIKLALETTFYNINSIKNKEVKFNLMHFMNNEGFKNLGINDYKQLYILDLYLYCMLQAVKKYNFFLMDKLYFTFKIKQYLPKILLNIFKF